MNDTKRIGREEPQRLAMPIDQLISARYSTATAAATAKTGCLSVGKCEASYYRFCYRLKLTPSGISACRRYHPVGMRGRIFRRSIWKGGSTPLFRIESVVVDRFELRVQSLPSPSASWSSLHVELLMQSYLRARNTSSEDWHTGAYLHTRTLGTRFRSPVYNL